MKKIIIATNNQGKIKEFKQIFKEFELLSLEEINLKIDVEENGNTFKENSEKKATQIYKLSGIPCIADDSGLCITQLNDWPGVLTARFLGENALQEQRNNYILEKTKNLRGNERKARVICNLTYVDNKQIVTVEGITQGKIATGKRGKNGFGFDEIFELENGKTLAQLTFDEKNKVSARKLAAENLLKLLTKK